MSIFDSNPDNTHCCSHCKQRSKVRDIVAIPVADNINLAKHDKPSEWLRSWEYLLLDKDDNVHWAPRMPVLGKGFKWAACPVCGMIGMHGFNG